MCCTAGSILLPPNLPQKGDAIRYHSDSHSTLPAILPPHLHPKPLLPKDGGQRGHRLLSSCLDAGHYRQTNPRRALAQNSSQIQRTEGENLSPRESQQQGILTSSSVEIETSPPQPNSGHQRATYDISPGSIDSLKNLRALSSSTMRDISSAVDNYSTWGKLQ